MIDTPGFDDTERSDTEILTLIADWLRDSYDSGTFLSGIIYLHRISDVRMMGSAISNLRMFRKLCGPDNLTSVHLVTTMWDKVTKEEGERRESDLTGPNGFWSAMVASGCVVERHDGSPESAQALMFELVRQSPFVVGMQKEMAAGKTLIETEAGSSLNEELIKMQRKYEEELAAIKEETEIAIKTGRFSGSSLVSPKLQVLAFE